MAESKTSVLEKSASQGSLMKVEDLITMATGLPEKNVVNFKLLQSILLILASQTRLLGQEVELNLDEDLDLSEFATGLQEAGSLVDKDKEKPSEEREKDSNNKKERQDQAEKKKGAKGKKDVETKGSSISVTERDGPGKEKVLVVEKGAKSADTDSSALPRVGSIDVVTASELRSLEAMVAELGQAGPLLPPTLPDDELRHGIARGTASLTDTMQAMQLTSRVEAVEGKIGQITDLLTDLAAAGTLPRGVAERAGAVQAGLQRLKTDVASVGVIEEPVSKKPKAGEGKKRKQEAFTVAFAAVNVPGPVGVGATSSHDDNADTRLITHPEMKEALRILLNELTKKFDMMDQNVTTAADAVANQAKLLAEKMQSMLKINTRVNALHPLMADCTETLTVLENGLTTQLQSYQEQRTQMQEDIRNVLENLRALGSNESIAVKELRQRYAELLQQLATVLNKHTQLDEYQKRLSNQLQGLMDNVEEMGEQKVDRIEVEDGLRDKADKAQVTALLTGQEFACAQGELRARLEGCEDRIRRQDKRWMVAVNDLYESLECKAELTELMTAREHVQEQLQALRGRVHHLGVLLGVPKAAFLCRKLTKDGTCGGEAPAVSEAAPGPPPGSPPRPPASPAPAWLPPAPALTPRHDQLVCTRVLAGPDSEYADQKAHMCHRFVGGSHTLVTSPRERCPPGPPGRPISRYLGEGTDGKIYKLERDMMPCVECNKMPADEPVVEESIPGATELAVEGGGDGVTSRRVTIFDDSDASRRVAIDSLESPAVVPAESRTGAPRDPRPSLMRELRLSMTQGPSSAAMEFMSTHLSDIGVGVKGRVTVMGEEAALRSAIMQEIVEQREKKMEAEVEGKAEDEGETKAEEKGEGKADTKGEALETEEAKIQQSPEE